MTPPHTWLMAPHTWLMPPPIVGWWPPYPYLPDAPPPNGWMMCWVKLVLVLYVWRQDRMRPAQQGLPFIRERKDNIYIYVRQHLQNKLCFRWDEFSYPWLNWNWLGKANTKSLDHIFSQWLNPHPYCYITTWDNKWSIIAISLWALGSIFANITVWFGPIRIVNWVQ